jgi:hypothetical protein
MRDLALSLVIGCVLGCGAKSAATVIGGDVQSQNNECSIETTCATGGGHGSMLLPLAVVGATALGIVGLVYVYHLVLPDVRVTTAAPP